MKRASPTEDRHKRLPLVDLLTRAEVIRTRTDLVTTVTIYGAALLATAGFVVAAVVDDVLRSRTGTRRTS